MSIPILSAVSDQKVYRHSSITQHKNTLSVLKKGEWLPLVCDHLDYIDCGRVVSHKVAVTDGEDIGYTYGVKECKYWTDNYLMGNNGYTTTSALPTWFGIGYYDDYKDSNVIINSDDESLGQHNELTLRVGTSYCLAEETLKAVE